MVSDDARSGAKARLRLAARGASGTGSESVRANPRRAVNSKPRLRLAAHPNPCFCPLRPEAEPMLERFAALLRQLSCAPSRPLAGRSMPLGPAASVRRWQGMGAASGAGGFLESAPFACFPGPLPVFSLAPAMNLPAYTRAQDLPATLSKRLVILDGAMGTMIQRFKLDEAIFSLLVTRFSI